MHQVGVGKTAVIAVACIVGVLFVWEAMSNLYAPAAAGSVNNVAKLSMVPAVATKKLYLIRHGEAWSNVHGHKDHSQYMNEAWFDASLSPNGWRQAHALGQHVKRLGLKPQVVIVSPLTRALQTAAAAFGSGPQESASSSSNNNNNNSVPLMVEFSAIPGSQEAHPAISSAGAPPFVCQELCREHLGVHPCDRRRATSYYREHFPAVDFSLVEQEQDVLWTPTTRETKDEIRARGAAFINWIKQRPETEIAVVSHSGFLHFMLSNFLQAQEDPTLLTSSSLTRWFENCELRSFTLVNPESYPRVDPVDFPGGMAALGELQN